MRHFVLITIAAITLAGCAPPVGTIGGTVKYDRMWTVPYRVYYDINDKFQRNEDLSVFASYHGAIQSIPVNKVKISIIEDPDWTETEKPVPNDADYPFKQKGRKAVVVKYGKLKTRYNIEVRDPFGLGDNDENGGGSGIIIEWWEDAQIISP